VLTPCVVTTPIWGVLCRWSVILRAEMLNPAKLLSAVLVLVHENVSVWGEAWELMTGLFF